jgi:hypothetical protein
MRDLYSILVAIPLMWFIGAPGAGAQQQSSEPSQQTQQQSQQQGQQQSQQTQNQSQGQNQNAQPIPALRSPLAGGADETAETDPNAMVEDERSLVGAQDLTLGSPKTGHSYWAPYAQLSSTLDSNPLSVSGGTGWLSWNTFYGGVDLNRISGNSNLMLTYLGGGSFSTGSGANTATEQQLGFSEDFKFHRAEIVLLDQLAYLPESSFGFAGIGGSTLGLGGNLGLQGGFTPNQSILTSLGQRISNSAIVEGNLYVTPRSFFTFVGSYGVLDFFGSNLNNSNETVGQAGYSYRMSRKDTIALLYAFDAFRFNHISQSINNNAIELSYARRVTGRLALQIAGGPAIAFSETPIATTSGLSTPSPTTPTTRTRQFFWSLNSYATYQLRRLSLRASYSHGVTGGSGVLAGSLSDNVNAGVSRQLARTATGSWTVGYARNQGVVIPGLNGTPLTGFCAPLETGNCLSTNQTYDYVYSGLSFSHTLARSTMLYVNYQVNYQNSDGSFCLTTVCSTHYLLHQISVGLGWRARPIAF